MSDIRPHFVYRCYDAADRLLYIGCTVGVEARMSAHDRQGSRWFPEMARYTTEEHPGRDAALAAEREAIRIESPMFNVHANHPVDCTVDGCDEPYHSKGYCMFHYGRNYHYGDPLAEPPGPTWLRNRNRSAA